MRRTERRTQRVLPKFVARLALAAFLASSLPALAGAQLGIGFGLRSVNGEETATANADRRGYEFRGLFDGSFNERFGWRAELAGVQMQYQKEIAPGDRTQVSENGVEFAALLRADFRQGAFTGAYAALGPVASWRLNCGVSGGFVDCDNTSGQRTGYTVGVGYRSPITPRRALLFEVKLIDGVVAGAGSPVISFGIGLTGL